ncbi:MFS transporter [Aestuariirhabdus litorea]|uniref:MFS transporter n=2 Tax=Aestuariirhabdus litorea TaxID=2528527 RepID=A0A3P3VTY9_9GAMM|nr:MFS transporter [Aestuariirhabdus litorea]RWW98667.1 MFS transporter [Endozoicomonadaceae bacterium GTF-13]
MGVRQSMGLLLPDMAQQLRWPLGDLSLAFGVQNLVWGAVAPFAGLAAERYGTQRVLLVGGLIYVFGLVLLALSESYWLYQLSNGLLVGVGVGATTFPVVLAAVGRLVDEHRRSFALGIVSAGGSSGQFLFALLTQWATEHYGWSLALLLLAACTLIILLFSPWLRSPREAGAVASPPLSLPASYRDARLWLLATGFFVCGFHVAFISVHLPNLVAICGLQPEVAGNALALIGLVNVGGVILAGWLGGRHHKPYLLSLIYLMRALLVVVFMLAPKTALSFYLFAAVMGMLWLSTVPLTSGSLAQYFGIQRLASLFGWVMFSHQVGAFVGAWLAGWVFDTTGNYDLIWILSAALGVVAALVHLPIRPPLRLASSEA